MKKTVIAICAILALMIAGRAMADDSHAGHKHETAATATHDHGTMYNCPMHKDVVSAKSGKCPKCGMDMAKMDGYGKKYHCPMHGDETFDKPGKCPKCGMKLEMLEQKEVGAKGK